MRNLPPIVYATVVGLLLACSDTTAPPEGPAVTRPPQNPPLPSGAFQVSPSTATLQAGQTFRFTTTYSGNQALSSHPGDVAWYSSDETVATVSSGIVRGVSGGQSRIFANWGGFQASALVTVIGAAKKHEDAVACLKRTYRRGQLLMTQC
jgi:uncharacterized protein YjdB